MVGARAQYNCLNQQNWLGLKLWLDFLAALSQLSCDRSDDKFSTNFFAGKHFDPSFSSQFLQNPLENSAVNCFFCEVSENLRTKIVLGDDNCAHLPSLDVVSSPARQCSCSSCCCFAGLSSKVSSSSRQQERDSSSLLSFVSLFGVIRFQSRLQQTVCKISCRAFLSNCTVQHKVREEVRAKRNLSF